MPDTVLSMQNILLGQTKVMQIRQRETLSHQGAIIHEVCCLAAQYFGRQSCHSAWLLAKNLLKWFPLRLLLLRWFLLKVGFCNSLSTNAVSTNVTFFLLTCKWGDSHSHTGRNCFNLFQISFSANTADAHPGVSGVSKDQKFVRNSKILIARSTIQPKLSKIKNNLPFFKQFWWII